VRGALAAAVSCAPDEMVMILPGLFAVTSTVCPLKSVMVAILADMSRVQRTSAGVTRA
jgi:hypothetical protein